MSCHIMLYHIIGLLIAYIYPGMQRYLGRPVTSNLEIPEQGGDKQSWNSWLSRQTRGDQTWNSELYEQAGDEQLEVRAI